MGRVDIPAPGEAEAPRTMPGTPESGMRNHTALVRHTRATRNKSSGSPLLQPRTLNPMVVAAEVTTLVVLADIRMQGVVVAWETRAAWTPLVIKTRRRACAV